MPEHHTPLIATIAFGLGFAFLLGLLAQRLRIQPLVGYLLAGVAVGPFTPGFVADQALATELAEIGVILLMFGVGLHFSLKDLASVARVAVPGAIGQIAAATAMGGALGLALGWTVGAALVFGLALSVASTVVLVRALQERRMLDTDRGRIAVGWLVVEDLAMVAALVLLPVAAAALAGGAASPLGMATTLGWTLAKVAAFIAVMLLIGRRIIPWVMHHAAHTGSRELFRLSVYACALGVAFVAAKLFDASFALGAFFAGMVLGETRLSQRATEEAMPLRDAFAVLFFVSVGMLFNPAVLIEQPLAVLATVAIIVLGKSAAAFLIVRAFGHPAGTALTVSASLAQIGEFSFILVGLGVALGLLPEAGRDLVLAGAILSIMLNPVVFALVDRRRPAPATPAPPAPAETGHEVIVGYGRVGSLIGARLVAAGRRVVVIEEREEALAAARAAGAETIPGHAADPEVLALADLATSRRLFVTIPEAFEAGQVVQQARALNPRLDILARAHSDAAVQHLEGLGANLTVLGESEIAARMIERALLPRATEPRAAAAAQALAGG
ncbi:MAG: cation:proton antiporter [Acetobacteraceae bacterium]|nr:cation:proton antiporter [Acetobacteraceae bacterium]